MKKQSKLQRKFDYNEIYISFILILGGILGHLHSLLINRCISFLFSNSDYYLGVSVAEAMTFSTKHDFSLKSRHLPTLPSWKRAAFLALPHSHGCSFLQLWLLVHHCSKCVLRKVILGLLTFNYSEISVCLPSMASPLSSLFTVSPCL